jgi:hypothetical protein
LYNKSDVRAPEKVTARSGETFDEVKGLMAMAAQTLDYKTRRYLVKNRVPEISPINES